MSEWALTPLGDVTSQVQDLVKVTPGSTYPLLGVKWYAEGPFLRETVTSETSKATRFYRARQGQFIYNRLFAWKGSFGLVGADLDGSFVSNEFPLFACDATRLLAEYLNLHFRQPHVWGEIERVSTGTTASRNRWKETQFNDYQVALPPLTEQRRIVDVMAAVDAQVETLVEEGERLANTTAVLRADYPDADEVDLASVLLGIDSGKSVQTDGEEPHPDGARILKLSAVRPGRFDAREAKYLNDDAENSFSSSQLVSEGDLLVTRANTPERVGYVVVARSVPARTYMPDLIWRARVDQTRASAEYLGHVLSSPEFRRRITGIAGGTSTSMVKINKKGFGGVRVPMPLLEAQDEYVAKCDVAQQSELLLASELARLRVFRSTLLTSLLSQEIEIPESYDDLLETMS